MDNLFIYTFQLYQCGLKYSYSFTSSDIKKTKPMFFLKHWAVNDLWKLSVKINFKNAKTDENYQAGFLLNLLSEVQLGEESELRAIKQRLPCIHSAEVRLQHAAE